MTFFLLFPLLSFEVDSGSKISLPRYKLYSNCKIEIPESLPLASAYSNLKMCRTNTQTNRIIEFDVYGDIFNFQKGKY